MRKIKSKRFSSTRPFSSSGENSDYKSMSGNPYGFSGYYSWSGVKCKLGSYLFSWSGLDRHMSYTSAHWTDEKA